jgi:pantetheine-phosphate adenylyltransferase
MMKRAVFPGSFDPFTKGHMEVLISALRLFDQIIVAVGQNVQKKGYFTVDQRLQIIKMATKGLDNVEVSSYGGLTVEFCKKAGADFIIRGLRTTTDFELETVIAQANSKLAPDITTVFIPAGNELSFISSTVVRDVLENGGDVKQFLPPGVELEKIAGE